VWSCLKYNTRLLTLPAPLDHVPRSYVMLQDPTLHPHTPSSQATVTLAHATAMWFIPLAKRQPQEMEEENPSHQHRVTSTGWVVMARMAVDDTDEMAMFPGIGRGWEGRCKVKRKQGGCQRLISLTLPRAPRQPVSRGVRSWQGLQHAGRERTGAELSPEC